MNNYGASPYRGNWGAYPFLPSGNIIANDMQNGMFVLNAAAAYSSTISNPVAVNELEAQKNSLVFYPNPATTKINIHSNATTACVLQVKNSLGQVFYEKNYDAQINDYLNVQELENGIYFLSLSGKNITQTKKLIISH